MIEPLLDLIGIPVLTVQPNLRTFDSGYNFNRFCHAKISGKDVCSHRELSRDRGHLLWKMWGALAKFFKDLMGHF